MWRKSIHHFLTNVICGLVWGRVRRRKVRVILNSPMSEYIRFIRADTGFRRLRLRTFIGYQARSLVISVNNKYVYKFPLRRDNYRELALREKRLVDAFAPISPIHIPWVELIEHNGMLIRKYEYIDGPILRTAPRRLIMKNLDTLATQMANFLYVIATSDPESIRDLKPENAKVPGYLYGWCQGDIGDNFIIDIDTMTVRAVIDWEDCEYFDFHSVLRPGKQLPSREFMPRVMREYDRIWKEHHKK